MEHVHAHWLMHHAGWQFRLHRTVLKPRWRPDGKKVSIVSDCSLSRFGRATERAATRALQGFQGASYSR